MRASSIILSVAAALSTVLPVFAAPINPADILGTISTIGSGVKANSNGADLNLSNLGPVTVPRDLPNANTNAGQVQNDEKAKLQSFPDIIVGVSNKLDGLLQQLGGVVSGKVGVAFETIDPILEEVCQVLSEAVAAVTYLVAHPIEGVLTLEGKVLSVADIAGLVSNLIHIVIAIITTAISAVGAVNLYLLMPIITTISDHVAAIVECAIKLVQDVNFLVVLKSLIQDVVAFIINTNSLSSLRTALQL